MNDILQLDQRLMLLLNGSDSLYLDGIMKLYSTTWIWIPLALFSIIILFKNNTLRNFILLAILITATVYLCDRVSSGFIKPWFSRLRPCNDPVILDQIDIVNGSRSGKFGFVSSHAANTFGIFMFLSLLFKHKGLTLSLLIWALIDCFSRIYLGLHYPGDVLCGAMFGMLVGGLIFFIYHFFNRRLDKTPSKITNFYTSSGYLVEDISNILLVLYLTYLFIAFYAFIYIGYKFM